MATVKCKNWFVHGGIDCRRNACVLSLLPLGHDKSSSSAVAKQFQAKKEHFVAGVAATVSLDKRAQAY